MLKQAIMFFSEQNVFFNYICALILIYVAQTMVKVRQVRKDGTFSWSKLINGIIDYALYFAAIIIFFFAGSFLPPEKTVITFDGKNYNIPDALTLLIWVLIIIQAGKFFKNIQATFNVKDEEIKQGTQENPLNTKEIG